VGIIAPNLHTLLAGEKEGYGGAELDMRHITECLLAQGWHPVILTQTLAAQPLSEWCGVPVRVIRPRPAGRRRSRLRPVALLADMLYIVRFCLALLRLPGPVWITKLAGLQSLLTMIVGRLRGIPVVFRFGHDDETNPDHVAQVCFHGQARLAEEFLRRLPQCAAVLAQTYQQAELARTRLGLQTRVIPNAHPVAALTIIPPEYRTNLLWVGRADPIKRPGLLLDALDQLPPIPTRMIMPPSGLNTDLAATIAQQATLFPNLTLVPGLSHAQVQREFAQARLFLLTSSGEGLPNVLLEALKYGTPVLSMVVNPDHILRNGLPDPRGTPAPGWCVGDDPAAFIKAIRILHYHPTLLAASSRAARQLALERFDLAAVGQQYDQLLCELC
jgi:glycosyltransferase involved in cell wall biosynthesis